MSAINVFSKPLLTIITPFYARSDEGYLLGRALSFIQLNFLAPWLERIIVDHGSPSHIAERVKLECEKHGWQYLNVRQGHQPFSAGHCRNTGVQMARGKFVSFQDVDLFAPASLYERIRSRLTDHELPFNHLEVIPCLYLTETASEAYLEDGIEISQQKVYQDYLADNREVIHAVAPISSSMIVRREFFLSEGGNRREFFGHGYEDFELMNRMAQRARLFHRSHDYYSHDYKYNSLDYKGYRTFFSMFGRENLNEKLFFVHLFHEVAPDPGYKHRNARNRKLFENFMRSFDIRRDAPPALDNPHDSERTLCIGSRSSVVFRSIRFAIPHMGAVSFRKETDFRNDKEFVEFINRERITRVLFTNPYGNEERERLYRSCRAREIPYMVFDRGAFPDSWFFDPNGFNADSSSLHEERWNHPISPDERATTEMYLHELCSSDTTLEKNGMRKGSYEVQRKFDLLDRKVLFIPMQRPNDSVIKHFSGSVEGIPHFTHVIGRLANLLPADWTIVVKQHPLESDDLEIPGVTVLPADTHVYDLLDAADAIAVINSGVGLLGLCFGKPVYCFGESFYCHPGLAQRVHSAKDLAAQLLAERSIDTEAVHRFVHYLISKYYSFSNTQYIEVEEDNTTRSVAIDLEFSTLRLPGKTVEFEFRDNPWGKNSPAYDYYRGYLQTAGVASAVAKKPAAKPATAVSKASPNTKDEEKVAAMSKSAMANANAPVNVIDIQRNSPFIRKARKLFREPGSFVKDAIRNHS